MMLMHVGIRLALLLACSAFIDNLAAKPVCNPNTGNVSYREVAAEETPGEDWENITYQRFQIERANQLSLDFAPLGWKNLLSLAFAHPTQVGTGPNNKKITPLDSTKITRLLPLSSAVLDDTTVMVLFLSPNPTAPCNLVKHRLFTAHVIENDGRMLKIKFGGFTFSVALDSLSRLQLTAADGVPKEMRGRVFVLTRETFALFNTGNSRAYDDAYARAKAQRPDILESYLAFQTRSARLRVAHKQKPRSFIQDSDFFDEIDKRHDGNCTTTKSDEFCVLAIALRNNEIRSNDIGFQISDALFQSSGPSFGWQQLDMATNSDKAQPAALSMFKSEAWPAPRIVTYQHPIRQYSTTQLNEFYEQFVPMADGALSLRDNQLKLVTVYVTSLEDSLAAATPREKLSPKMSDDDKHLVRLLQADYFNNTYRKLKVGDETSACEVLNSAPAWRKNGKQSYRWRNIVKQYNADFGATASSCD
jgi:hypothetical protein